MHRHDFELVADLASGALDDETRARELVEECAQCRAEYELHSSVIAELGAVEPVRMTDQERAALHRDLWTELRSGSSPTSQRLPLWYRWSFAAVGLFLVVGAFAVLSNMGANDSSDADLTITEAGAETTIQAEGALAEAPSNTAMAPGDSAEDLLADQGADGGSIGFYSSQIETARSAPESQSPPVFDPPSLANTVEACLIAAGLENHQAVGEINDETSYLLAIGRDEEFSVSSVITVVDFATCEIVHVDEDE